MKIALTKKQVEIIVDALKQYHIDLVQLRGSTFCPQDDWDELEADIDAVQEITKYLEEKL